MPKIPTRKAYDAVPALNYSLAKQLLISPLHARQYLDTPREETKALRIGSAVHCAALEPEAFPRRYLCGLDVDKRTKAGKEAYEALMAAAGDKIVLSPDGWDNRVSHSDRSKPIRAMACPRKREKSRRVGPRLASHRRVTR